LIKDGLITFLPYSQLFVVKVESITPQIKSS